MKWRELLAEQIPNEHQRGRLQLELIEEVRRIKWRLCQALQPHDDWYLDERWDAVAEAEVRERPASSEDTRRVLRAYLCTAVERKSIEVLRIIRRRQEILAAQPEPEGTTEGDPEEDSAVLESERLMTILNETMEAWAEEERNERPNMPTFIDFLIGLGASRLLTFYRGGGSQLDQTGLRNEYLKTYGLGSDEDTVNAVRDLVKRGVENLKARLETQNDALKKRRSS